MQSLSIASLSKDFEFHDSNSRANSRNWQQGLVSSTTRFTVFSEYGWSIREEGTASRLTHDLLPQSGC